MKPVVVVGGGVVGLAVAGALSPDRPVTVVERGELGEGTTALSMAVFHRQSPSPTAFDAGLSRTAWETYGPAVETGELSYERIGALHVAETGAFARRLADAAGTLSDLGIETEALDAASLDRFGIDGEHLEGGIYTPDEGYVEPGELIPWFADRCRERGGEILTDTEVVGIRVEDRAVVGVETGRGSIDGAVVVNAAGPWADRIDAMVGLSLPLARTRGPILDLGVRNPPEPFTLFERGSYLRSHEEGVYVGRYATDFEGRETVDPDDPGSVSDPFRVGVDDLARFVPALDGAPVEDEWVGVRTVTPDGRPFVGEAGVAGYHVATGMSGLGVTLAPAVARLLARSIETDEPVPEELSPSRID
ncbi:NAD(P)/FAD-dependent oxidoreductase [Natronorarus salvus]|uniref:NAD(P)/FAD-dependent oxidoreductase n=1 Tax=Natronorarus salvus TaxID=3117733 RepID=UPI002F263BB7